MGRGRKLILECEVRTKEMIVACKACEEDANEISMRLARSAQLAMAAANTKGQGDLYEARAKDELTNFSAGTASLEKRLNGTVEKYGKEIKKAYKTYANAYKYIDEYNAKAYKRGGERKNPKEKTKLRNVGQYMKVLEHAIADSKDSYGTFKRIATNEILYV